MDTLSLRCPRDSQVEISSSRKRSSEKRWGLEVSFALWDISYQLGDTFTQDTSPQSSQCPEMGEGRRPEYCNIPG